MGLKQLFGRQDKDESARNLYIGIISQARQPEFYRHLGVPDSLDGRFDLIVLHVFLVLNRLKREHARTAELSQALFDLLFLDMDQSLREMGVGDVGIGKRVKAMVQGFYGRISAYESALEGPESALREALKRNLFGTVEPKPEQLEAMSAYVRSEVAALAEKTLDELAHGKLCFDDAAAVLPRFPHESEDDLGPGRSG